MTALKFGLEHLQVRLEDALRSGAESALRGSVEELCSWLRDAEPERLVQPRLVSAVQSAAVRAAGLLEKHTARRLLACGEAGGDYFRQVSQFTLLEAEAAAVNAHSRVLFVGAGALPTSACTLRGHFGCRVDCLDIDLEACRLARAVLDQGGLDLGVIWGRSERQKLDGYTHLWIASLVPDKEALLGALLPRLAPGCRLLVRYGNGLRRAFNHGLQLPVDGWQADETVRQAGHLHDTALMTAPLAWPR